MKTLSELMSTFVTTGSVRWIGVRPQRRAAVQAINSVEITESGLVGDRYANPGKRSVTLIQYEHLAVIAALVGRQVIEPELLRRNIVVSGINLLSLRSHTFRIGSVVLDGTGICAPCSLMEDVLGKGGYTALRGHGGITARVVRPGLVALGDTVDYVPSDTVLV